MINLNKNFITRYRLTLIGLAYMLGDNVFLIYKHQSLDKLIDVYNLAMLILLFVLYFIEKGLTKEVYEGQ